MKYYIINEKRLLELLKKENQLDALECAGVDNWPGYYEAKDLYTDNQDVSYEEMALEDLKDEFESIETDYKEAFKIQKKFEIEPGIIISKLDIKDGDNIIVTVDMDIWDIDVASEICKITSEIFPNNNIITTFKGIEIVDAGPSPK